MIESIPPIPTGAAVVDLTATTAASPMNPGEWASDDGPDEYERIRDTGRPSWGL